MGEVESTYSSFARRLTVMGILLDSHDVSLLVQGLPLRFRIGAQRRDDERGFDVRRIRIEPLDRIAEHCKETGIRSVGLRPRMRTERQAMIDGEKEWNDMYIQWDYARRNQRGPRISAEEVLEAINRHGWLRMNHRLWRRCHS